MGARLALLLAWAFGTSSMGVVSGAPSSSGCTSIYGIEDFPLSLPGPPQPSPLCVAIGELYHVPSVQLVFEVRPWKPGDVVCVKVEGVRSDKYCSSGHSDVFLIHLLPPTTPLQYEVTVLGAQEAGGYAPKDVEVDVLFSRGSVPPSPPTPPGALPPLPPPPPPFAGCDRYALYALALCASDAVAIGCEPAAVSEEAELSCLEAHESSLSLECRSALLAPEASLEACMHAGGRLLPMEIATVLLLATAAFTLLCTLVRCCCQRGRCTVAGRRRARSDLEESLELTDDDEPLDDEPTPRAERDADEQRRDRRGAPNGRGAPRGRTAARARSAADKAAAKVEKQAAQAEPSLNEAGEDDDHDELPAYNQVVENASLTVQPLTVQPLQFDPAPAQTPGSSAGTSAGTC